MGFACVVSRRPTAAPPPASRSPLSRGAPARARLASTLHTCRACPWSAMRCQGSAPCPRGPQGGDTHGAANSPPTRSRSLSTKNSLDRHGRGPGDGGAGRGWPGHHSRAAHCAWDGRGEGVGVGVRVGPMRGSSCVAARGVEGLRPPRPAPQVITRRMPSTSVERRGGCCFGEVGTRLAPQWAERVPLLQLPRRRRRPTWAPD